MLQHLPLVLLALDAGQRLASCNHEFERLTGYRAEEVMGRPLWELLEVDAEQREELLTAHPPEGGNYRGVPWSLRCKDGSLRGASWSNFSRFVAIAGWPNWMVGVDRGPVPPPGRVAWHGAGAPRPRGSAPCAGGSCGAPARPDATPATSDASGDGV